MSCYVIQEGKLIQEMLNLGKLRKQLVGAFVITIQMEFSPSPPLINHCDLSMAGGVLVECGNKGFRDLLIFSAHYEC